MYHLVLESKASGLVTSSCKWEGSERRAVGLGAGLLWEKAYARGSGS